MFESTPSPRSKALRMAKRGMVVFSLLMACNGCRNRAYNEFYVESMNKENRLLEDRIYEYDAEYQALERENLELQRTNEALQRKLYETPKIDTGRSRTKREVVPGLQEPSTNGSKSLLNKPNGKPESKSSIPKSNEELLPAKDPSSSLMPRVDALEEDVVMPGLGGTTLPNGNKNLKDGLNNPASPVSPPNPQLQLPGTPNNTVPSLLPGAFPRRDGSDKGASHRIVIPKLVLDEGIQQASATEPIVSSSPNTIQSQPLDQRVVEIAFHPTMCRGHNFDAKPGDDGLYLVVTPVNAAGQSINVVGKLTVVIEEPEVAPEQSRIDAWDFEPEALEEFLEPIGVSQGYHLSLPWHGKEPQGNVVTVYVRYILDDGRTMVNKREVRLRRPTSAQSTWTPR